MTAQLSLLPTEQRSYDIYHDGTHWRILRTLNGAEHTLIRKFDQRWRAERVLTELYEMYGLSVKEQ